MLQTVKDQSASPLGVLSTKNDFFGNALDTEVDAILGKLQQQPCDVTLFEEMVKRCLSSVVKVLRRRGTCWQSYPGEVLRRGRRRRLVIVTV